MIDASQAKRAAAAAAADLVEDGMRLGLGSGSTFQLVLERLAERMRKDGLKIAGVPTSRATAEAAQRLGIPLLSLVEVDTLDLAIDGADEVDPHKNLIKGGGGAHVREKIVAAAARELVVVIDQGKLVEVLGKQFRLPVEVLQFGWKQAERAIAATGCKPQLRQDKGGEPTITDNGNYILDCKFDGIEDPAWLHAHLNSLPGVLDNGLFVGISGRVVVGDADGRTRIIP
jgi:ribose 5-phosphate isomerase A